ncbi:MAG: cell division protein SepF [Nanoarchaeota archaeon]
MRDFFSNVKNRLGLSSDDFTEGTDEEYVELDTDVSTDHHRKTKITVRPFVLEDFSDVKPIIDALREGYTICLVNIKPLKGKDIVELKRAINKLKKTCDAIAGDVAGFGEDWIVATPGFAEIYRAQRGAAGASPQKRTTELVEENEQHNDQKTVLEQYDTDDVF